MIDWKASVGNCEWLALVFVCKLLNTAKYVVCFYDCKKPSLEVFYIGGVFRGFGRFTEKTPAVGFLLNKVLRRTSGAGVSSWICEIFGSTCPVDHERLFLYWFGTTVRILS